VPLLWNAMLAPGSPAAAPVVVGVRWPLRFGMCVRKAEPKSGTEIRIGTEKHTEPLAMNATEAITGCGQPFTTNRSRK